jgi:hypothetical protein
MQLVTESTSGRAGGDYLTRRLSRILYAARGYAVIDRRSLIQANEITIDQQRERSIEILELITRKNEQRF